MSLQYMLVFFDTPAEACKRNDPGPALAYWGAWQAYMGAPAWAASSPCAMSGQGATEVRPVLAAPLR